MIKECVRSPGALLNQAIADSCAWSALSGLSIPYGTRLKILHFLGPIELLVPSLIHLCYGFEERGKLQCGS
jgi:hypothetical protein